MRPGTRKMLGLSSPLAGMIEKLEKIKAGIQAKVEPPFRLIKRQSGHVKVRD
jgi:IS5 family transposase